MLALDVIEKTDERDFVSQIVQSDLLLKIEKYVRRPSRILCKGKLNLPPR